jgi:hypothetical protein
LCPQKLNKKTTVRMIHLKTFSLCTYTHVYVVRCYQRPIRNGRMTPSGRSRAPAAPPPPVYKKTWANQPGRPVRFQSPALPKRLSRIFSRSFTFSSRTFLTGLEKKSAESFYNTVLPAHIIGCCVCVFELVVVTGVV